MKDPQKSSYIMKMPSKQRLRNEFGFNDQVLVSNETKKIEATAALLHITKSGKADW